jgi:hypothetical protein
MGCRLLESLGGFDGEAFRSDHGEGTPSNPYTGQTRQSDRRE